MRLKNMASLKVDKSVPPRPAKPMLSATKARQNSTGSIPSVCNVNTRGVGDEVQSILGKEAPELGLDARELLVSQSILQDAYSKSAPASEVSSPDSVAIDPLLNSDNAAVSDSPHTALSMTNQLRLAQNMAPLPPPPSAEVLSTQVKIVGSERSFMSGIRSRLQDPLNAFTGRFEDFIVEKGIIDARKLRKSEVTEQKMLTSASDSGIADLEKKNSFQNGKPLQTEMVQLARHQEPVENVASKILPNLPPTKPELKLDAEADNLITKQRTSSCDIPNDYYAVEAEDFFGSPSFDFGPQNGSMLKSCSLDTFSRQTGQQSVPSKDSPKKIKATLQKLIQPIAGFSSPTAIKSTSSAGQMSMTLSELLNNNIDEGSLSDVSDQFYDPQDEVSVPIKSHETSKDEDLPSSDKIIESSTKETEAVPIKTPKRPSNFPIKHKLMAVFMLVLAYLLVPLPAYVAGMVFGAFLATVVISAYLWWTAPRRIPDQFISCDVLNEQPLEFPEMKIGRHEDEFKGWMNELYNYDENDYHIGQTHSVRVHLEGRRLRLQIPKFNIPRRAFWDEPNYFTSIFVKQRHLDLFEAKVMLMPENIVAKRLWSKKYPICLIPARELSPSEGCPGDKASKIYLFARCARDKEEWFRRFQAASQGKPLPMSLAAVLRTGEKTHRRMGSSSSLDNLRLRHKRQGSTDSNISDADKEIPVVHCDTSHEQRLYSYLRYMARVIPAENQQHLRAPTPDGTVPRLPTAVTCEPQVSWVNALVTRAFLDFLHEEYWVNKIREKIQKKIGKIHIPWFIDDLSVTGCELGSEMPVIRRAAKPYLDERGLWIDLDIAYTGGFRLQLETKCNLMKLKQKQSVVSRTPKTKQTRSPITHSDEEDSAESSTDEEACEENMGDEKMAQPQSGGAGGTILRIVDKITQSKYFHKATEYKYIKKAMEGVSNTRLVLIVEVKNIAGTLALNIPPPPTDRLWYGFRTSPRLWLSAKPWVGEREVSLSHVTDWIEKKLAVEFQRVFVMPNMDDIPIPIMCDHLNSFQADVL